MKIVLDGQRKSDTVKRIYALEADGEKYLIWCGEGDYKITLEPSARGFHCEREGIDVYVYPAPAPGSVIVVDNGDTQREFIFAGDMLIPR